MESKLSCLQEKEGGKNEETLCYFKVLTPPPLPSCTFLRLLLILLFSRVVPALSLMGETVEKDRCCIINNRSHARYVEQC